MNDILVAFYYALPYLMAAGAAMLLIGLALTAANRPVLVTLIYLGVMYWVPEISYGRIDDATGGSFYSKGAGVLVFPAMLWFVLAAVAWLHFSDKFSPVPPARPAVSLSTWFVAWALLLVAHVAWGLVTDVEFRAVVSPSGFSNVVWMGLFAALVAATLRTERDARLLLWFMFIVGVLRAGFGLVRWAAFGGDPANAYANRHGLSLKLTFFDVYDSLICMLAIGVAVLWLFPRSTDGVAPRSKLLKAVLWAGIGICLACIVLSFRRTASIGLLLAGAFVAFHVSSSGKRTMLFVGAPLALAAGLYAIWKRLSQTKDAGGLSNLLFDITPSTYGPDSARLLELKLAWESFLDNPVFGVGAWGSYANWHLVSWQLYEGGGGSYLHSGVLHLGLKAGLVGLALFFGLLFVLYRHWRAIRPQLRGNAVVLGTCGIAGLLFILPDFLIGTSLTKYRAVLFIGFCMALPYAASALSRAPTRAGGTVAAGMSGLAPGRRLLMPLARP